MIPSHVKKQTKPRLVQDSENKKQSSTWFDEWKESELNFEMAANSEKHPIPEQFCCLKIFNNKNQLIKRKELFKPARQL